MRFAFALGLAPILLLAGCGGGGGNTAASAPEHKLPAVKPPAGQEWTDVVVTTPEGGYRMGNPDAPIKLVEYGSRTCPVCGEFGRKGTQPLENNYVKTGRISWEFREYLVHGQPDYAPALLGRCVGTSAFFPLLEAMYVEQGPIEDKMEAQPAQALAQSLQGQPPTVVANKWADYLGYIDFVKQRGIPEAKARACLNDAKAFEQILKVMNDAAQNKGVNGTPTFFINGAIVPDASSWDRLEPALKAAGA